MNNRLIGAGIGLAVITVLIFFIFGTKGGDKDKPLSGFKVVKELISQGKLEEAAERMDGIRDKDPDSGMLGVIYFELARSYEKERNIVKARDIYALILNRYQDVENILEVQEDLSRLNTEILFSRIVTDEDVLYEISPGDTLSKIAKRFGTTVDLIKASNSLKSDIIRPNSKLKVSRARYKILVDKSQNLLTLLSSDNELVKVYQVSTGKNNTTPVGSFKIVEKIKDPPWHKDGKVIPPEDPKNILGSRWLGISEPGYGIHGTKDPESVGQHVTEGCIRMLNSDVEELFTIVPRGTGVTIVD